MTEHDPTDRARLASAVGRVRAAFDRADYTVDGVAELLGPLASAALVRGEIVPALRATTDGGPLATLLRLFVLQRPVRLTEAQAALPLEDAQALGLVVRDGGEVRAVVDVRPYGEGEVDWWVVSDLAAGLGPPGTAEAHEVGAEHVLGIGGASLTLAGLASRAPVATALDLGTGSGVQALHLSRHAGRVVATDTNPRALELAALTFAFSGVDVELRRGSLFGPVEGERFDQVVSNPPFVVSPGARFTYRDAGFDGDDLCRRLVEQVPAVVADGGTVALLANWLHVDGEDWRERVGSWVRPTGLDAWVVQREVQDPAEYVELWLRDGGDHRRPDYWERYDAWLSAFEERGVRGIGFGWITLHAAGAARPDVRLEELRGHVDGAFSTHVADRVARTAWLRAHEADATLAAAVLAPTTGIRLEQVSAAGEQGWVAERPRLAAGGLGRSAAVDPVGARVVTESDGRRSVAEVLEAVETASSLAPGTLAEGALDALRGLVEDGFLTPVDLAAPA